jgi:magnesium chelatase subunit I
MDLYACVPAISGKLELVFEGQETGAERVAQRLIGLAIKAVFQRHFETSPLEGDPSAKDIWAEVTQWFNQGGRLNLLESETRVEHRKHLENIPSLKSIVSKQFGDIKDHQLDFLMAMAIDGLHHYSLLSKDGLGHTTVYGDALSDMMDDFQG